MATIEAPKESPKKVKTPSDEGIVRLDGACHQLIENRKRPLLVLFYPGKASMSEDDLPDVYNQFREAHVVPEEKLDDLDILIDSYGGNPVAGYRLAQLIRDFSKKASFLVPYRAYSAATLLCFGGNEVRLGHYAGLSPIDITLVYPRGTTPEHEIELATIDSFMQFAVDARKRIEEQLLKLGCAGTTNVDSDLLVAMVKEIGSLRVAKFFRERTLTGHYAKELLEGYMFRDALDQDDRRDRVISNFLHGAPSHDFHLDYHLCERRGIYVREMPTTESDLSRTIVDTLEELVKMRVICFDLSRREKMPFFRFYPYTPSPVTEVKNASSTT